MLFAADRAARRLQSLVHPTRVPLLAYWPESLSASDTQVFPCWPPTESEDATRIAILRAEGRSWREITEETGINTRGTSQRALHSLPKNPTCISPAST